MNVGQVDFDVVSAALALVTTGLIGQNLNLNESGQQHLGALLE